MRVSLTRFKRNQAQTPRKMSPMVPASMCTQSLAAAFHSICASGPAARGDLHFVRFASFGRRGGKNKNKWEQAGRRTARPDW